MAEYIIAGFWTLKELFSSSHGAGCLGALEIGDEEGEDSMVLG